MGHLDAPADLVDFLLVCDSSAHWHRLIENSTQLPVQIHLTHPKMTLYFMSSLVLDPLGKIEVPYLIARMRIIADSL